MFLLLHFKALLTNFLLSAFIFLCSILFCAQLFQFYIIYLLWGVAKKWATRFTTAAGRQQLLSSTRTVGGCTRLVLWQSNALFNSNWLFEPDVNVSPVESVLQVGHVPPTLATIIVNDLMCKVLIQLSNATLEFYRRRSLAKNQNI